MHRVATVTDFTILGGSGFIGTSLGKYLKAKGHSVFSPSRSEMNSLPHELGHVIYAVGLTGDFRQRLIETVDAHVNVLAKIISDNKFSSFLYLSSTRVYSGVISDGAVNEDAPIPVRPGTDAVYDLSKLLGESFCLMQDNHSVRVARLSNVYGCGQSKHTFLQMLIDEINEKGEVEIREAPVSGKDYVSVDDVLCALENIALHGQERIYNIASGELVTHEELSKMLARLSGAKITFAEGGVVRRFPLISVESLVNEFGWAPQSVLRGLDVFFRI